MGYAMDQFHTLDLALFLAGAFAAAFVTGLAGFAFAIVAAAVWLHFMAPAQATPLIIAFGLIVQGVSVWKLRRAIQWKRLMPFLVGLPALALGTWAGLQLFGKLDDQAFRRIVLVLLLISGASLLVLGR